MYFSDGHAMKRVWLINNVVLFEPNERRLCAIQNYPDQCIILHGPVSECLLQLLLHNGEVLSQRFLFDAVWGKQGAVVTTNALYQAIASVRKALKSAGLTDEVIKTIPKAGFKSVAQICTGEAGDFLPRAKDVPAPAIVEPIPIANDNTIIDQQDSKLGSLLRAPVSWFFAGLLFCLSCAVLYGSLNNDKSVFADYQQIGKIGNCEVFSSWYDIEQSRSQFNALSARYPVNCKAGDRAYMTINRLQQGISIFVCDKTPDSVNARCRTLFYRQKYHENQ